MSALIAEAFALRRQCREDYDLTLYAAFVRAEAATNGALLNERGESRGIDTLSLFMGNTIRAHAYASEELIDHWRHHPRVTFAEFERRWMRDREQELMSAAG